ncbi:MAG: hypothetical protein ACRDZZ_14935 [Ilumatobacteraceae bacterium]
MGQPRNQSGPRCVQRGMTSVHLHFRSVVAMLAVVPGIALSACGSDDPTQAAPEPTDALAGTAPVVTSNSPVPTRATPGAAPVEVVGLYESIEFYPACGNETLDHQDGLTRVAPPGPGDDIGTLVVWADGVARWTSDSGDLDVWMIDDEIVYNWVC